MSNTQCKCLTLKGKCFAYENGIFYSHISQNVTNTEFCDFKNWCTDTAILFVDNVVNFFYSLWQMANLPFFPVVN